MLLVASCGVSHLSCWNLLNTAFPTKWALVILYLWISIELSVFVLIVYLINACLIFSCEPSFDGLVTTSMWGKFICYKSIFELAPIDAELSTRCKPCERIEDVCDFFPDNDLMISSKSIGTGKSSIAPGLDLFCFNAFDALLLLKFLSLNYYCA